MSLLKDTVVKGMYYNSIGINDYAVWSKIMLDYFGPGIKQQMKNIRTWSIAMPGSVPKSYDPKLNCWEFMGCGLQKDGQLIKTNTRDICPACLEKKFDGIHGGENAGRSCWVVLHTMCCGEIQDTYEHKYKVCALCDFYRSVKEEENSNFINPHILKEML